MEKKEPPDNLAALAIAFRRLPKDCYPLSLLGSAHGAGFGANAAFDALFGIDFKLAIAFGNSLLGAFGFASAAADAFVRNFVSHIVTPPNMIVFYSHVKSMISSSGIKGNRSGKILYIVHK